MSALTFELPKNSKISDVHFYQLCREHPEIKFERKATGEIIIMSPTGGSTGKQNFEISVEFGIWNRRAKLGVCFDSSTCFKLPNGAHRSPDVAWVKKERWESLNTEDQERFPPIAPDFVLELMSPSDRREEMRLKMQEYVDNGVQLGWLIDTKARQVEIYRPQQSAKILDSPASLSGEEILPDFNLDLSLVW